MLTFLIANSAELVNGAYPGGASADDPVPSNVAYYGNDILYGVLGFIALASLVFLVTRLNVDR